MLKDQINFSKSPFPEVKTSFREGFDYRKYLDSLFNTEDCQYYRDYTIKKISSKKFDKEFERISLAESNEISSIYIYDNTAEIAQEIYYDKMNGDTCIYSPEGFDIIKVKMPFAQIRFNKWTKFIKAIGLYFYYLNRNISEEVLFDYLLSVFDSYVKIPKNDKFIQNRLVKIKGKLNESIPFRSLYINEIEEKLKLIVRQVLETDFNKEKIKPNVKINVIYNPDYNLSVSERRRESKLAINKYKKDNKIEFYNQIINEWNFEKDGKITQDKVLEKVSYSIATVIRDWPNFKKKVFVLNKMFKEAS